MPAQNEQQKTVKRDKEKYTKGKEISVYDLRKIEKFKNLSVKKAPLNIEKLKTYPELDKISDKEAEEIIASLNQFALITFEFYHNKIKST